MRVQVGRGSVTVINATPFRERSLFDGDHGRLLVAATQMRRGDEVHFLSEDDHPSLLALLWQYGAPVVVLLVGAHRARAVARRRPVRAARGGAGRGAPLAGRADPRHGTVRAAHGGGDLASRGLPCAPSTKRRDAGFRATRSLSAKERAAALGAPHRPRSEDARRRAVHHGDGAPLPRTPQHDRARSRRRGVERSIEDTRSFAWNTIETDGDFRKPPMLHRRSARGHRSRDGRAVGGHRAGAGGARRVGARPDRRRARPRQDAARAGVGAGAVARARARAVHARHDAVRHHRSRDARSVDARAADRPRPGVHARVAGRRDQSRAGEDAERPARSDAGIPGDARRADATAAEAIHGARDAESRSKPKEPIRCPRRSSTGSCSRSRSAIRRAPRRWRSSYGRRRTRPATSCRWRT